MSDRPTLLRSIGVPFGLYFRTGHNDHRAFERALSADMPPFSGAVFNASRTTIQSDLRVELRRRGVEAVLDPMALELALPGGWERETLRKLPWAGKQRHTPGQFDDEGRSRFANNLVKFALKYRYTAIIAPTHYLAGGVADEWWPRDREIIDALLTVLSGLSRQERPRLYYRLAAPRKVLQDEAQREEFIRGLGEFDVDALWLAIHRIGASSGPSAPRFCMQVCADLKQLKVPLIGEHTGVLGTALLAFGALDGAESSITYGETFDVARILRPPARRQGSKRGGISPRVYIERLGMFLQPAEAVTFFGRRGHKGRFGCQGRACCRQIDDMIQYPVRHFVVTRSEEVRNLANVPPHDRATVHLERFLRPASDMALEAAKFDEKKFGPVANQLRGWRLAFGALLAEQKEPDLRKKADVIHLRRR